LEERIGFVDHGKFVLIPDGLKEKLERANFSYARIRELIPLENTDQFHAMAEKAIA